MVSTLATEGATLGLFAKAVCYTLGYALIVYVPLRCVVEMMARAQAAARRRKEIRLRKIRVVRGYIIR